MAEAIEIIPIADLRSQIAELRRQLDLTVLEYQHARKLGDSERAASLSRRRSALTRELFVAQSQLLHSLRTQTPAE